VSIRNGEVVKVPKYFHYPFVAILNCKESKFDDLAKICADIRKVDATFVYLAQRKRTRVLLYCEDETNAHLRGTWFVHKTDCVKFYAVLKNQFYRGGD